MSEFKVGDLVVIINRFRDIAFNDWFDSNDIFKVRNCGSLVLIRKGYVYLSITDNLIRHATQEEIAAGRRID